MFVYEHRNNIQDKCESVSVFVFKGSSGAVAISSTPDNFKMQQAEIDRLVEQAKIHRAAADEQTKYVRKLQEELKESQNSSRGTEQEQLLETAGSKRSRTQGSKTPQKICHYQQDTTLLFVQSQLTECISKLSGEKTACLSGIREYIKDHKDIKTIRAHIKDLVKQWGEEDSKSNLSKKDNPDILRRTLEIEGKKNAAEKQLKGREKELASSELANQKRTKSNLHIDECACVHACV